MKKIFLGIFLLFSIALLNGCSSNSQNNILSPEERITPTKEDIKENTEIQIKEEEKILEGSSETPSAKETPLPQGIQITFDSCGEKEKYASSSWYSDFIAAAQKLNQIEDYEVNYLGNDYKPLPNEPFQVDRITDICFSVNGNMVLALAPGDYGGIGFKLLKYDTASKVLSLAKREDIHGGKESNWYKKTDANYQKQGIPQKDQYVWFATPREFGKRVGNQIIMTGKDGEAGVTQTTEFIYDFRKNYVTIIKRCNSDVNSDKEKSGTDKCTEYSQIPSL
ncbi:hypothetical protein HZA38_00100 [Candidatus Peregrinibacteria bacterium]|nr:hypothetical protein [Candidatus Peregrinibacteria bacterium]